jgi:2,4'-dihydroxyacetophenone dioxygenase
VKGKRDAELMRSLELAFEAVPPRDTNEAHEELSAVGLDPVQFVLGLAQALRSNWATVTELGEQPTGGAKGQNIMATSVASAMTHYNFDDRKMRWFNFGDFKHFVFAMCDVDLERRLVDFILKFEPNEQIFLHRHLALTNTLVVQGEHRLYEPNGRLKEIRPTGSYTSTPPGEPHREGGGNEGAVVFYSVRAGDGDVLFEVLDDDLKVVGALSMADFIEALEEQKAS